MKLVEDWKVLETLSDHLYLLLRLRLSRHARIANRRQRAPLPANSEACNRRYCGRWAVKRLNPFACGGPRSHVTGKRLVLWILIEKLPGFRRSSDDVRSSDASHIIG